MESGHHGSHATVADLYETEYQGYKAAVEGRFCRLFDLRADSSPRHRLVRLGRTDGPMDEQTAQDVIGDSDVPAGFTFFGQFVDHDITLDTISRLDAPAVPNSIRNGRTPTLDLDNIYAGGPEATPYLYKADGHLLTRLATDIHTSLKFRELLRVNVGGGTRRAVIGDPRNDENPFVAQLQLAMIEFHNQVLDAVGEFEPARDTVIHYYHRVIMEDFLARIISSELLTDICVHGNAYYQFECADRTPCMPVEFSVAAYRYGHSQVRAFYNYNDNCLNVDVFELGSFDSVKSKIDWKYLFELPGGQTLMARKIDPALPHRLMAMPMRITGKEGDSLAARNLLRGRSFQLPSGQAVAQKMKDEDKLIGGNVLDVNQTLVDLGFKETPLWYYCLQEAQVNGSGNKLGPVGGRIVGEVLVGLVEEYRNRTGKGLDYLPAVSVPQSDPGRFQITDVLKYAGVA